MGDTVARGSAASAHNQARIVELLRKQQTLTKQEIASQLGWSMPTTLQNINDLIERGILQECGELESTGGRKAKRIGLCREAGLAVGIDAALHHVELVLTDLTGEVRERTVLSHPFRDQPEWYRTLGNELEWFLTACGVDPARVLAAGLSFPGIIDDGAQEIVHSHIFGLQHVSLDRFQRAVPFPLVAANDANCACFAELSAGHASYLYVSLNESVGGALVLNHQLHLGDTCQAGEIGHMLLIPGGDACYCGKQGCADAYLSPKVLRRPGQTMAAFLRQVHAGEREACEKWDSYLTHLAVFLTNLRMMLNVDLIVGGEVGKYIRPYLEILCDKAAQYDRFARDVDYIYPCSRTENAFAAGAAMMALEKYGSRVLECRKESEDETGRDF